MSDPKFCISCGYALFPDAQFCSNCGTQIPKKSAPLPPVITPSTSYTGEYAKRGDESARYDQDRPTGVLVLCVLIGLGIVMNIGGKLLVFSDFSYVPILGIIDLSFVVLQILVAYSLFNMKSWGGIAAIGVYLINIAYTFIIYVFFVDLIIERAIASSPYMEQLASNPIYVAIFRDFKQTTINSIRLSISTSLLSSFLISLIIGILILAYVYSKREFFVNP